MANAPMPVNIKIHQEMPILQEAGATHKFFSI